MSGNVVGRNDPCPCGSGLKYKKCCLGRRSDSPSDGVSGGIHEDIRQVLQGRHFDSLEEAQAFVDAYVQKIRQKPLEDFCGLTSDQMHRFLYAPFVSPSLVSFPETLAEEPAAPVLELFTLLVEAIGDKGLKPTAKGNLPRNFCREAALSFWGEDGYREHTQYGQINMEADFLDLHVARLIAEMAGLIRKYKGRFILSRDCRSRLSQGGLSAIYPRLFRASTEEFNWGYWDGYPEAPLIQQAFLFTLYLLKRFGDDCRSSVFYEDHFLRAFPMLVEEIEPRAYQAPEHQARNCYTLRSFYRFARFMGLATVEEVAHSDPFVHEYRITKTPLLDQAVRFAL